MTLITYLEHIMKEALATNSRNKLCDYPFLLHVLPKSEPCSEIAIRVGDADINTSLSSISIGFISLSQNVPN